MIVYIEMKIDNFFRQYAEASILIYRLYTVDSTIDKNIAESLAMEWLQVPNKAFFGMCPYELILLGDGDVLISYLKDLVKEKN